MEPNTNAGGTNTVLIVIVIIILLVGGFFLYNKDKKTSDNKGGLDVNVTLPAGNGGDDSTDKSAY